MFRDHDIKIGLNFLQLNQWLHNIWMQCNVDQSLPQYHNKKICWSAATWSVNIVIIFDQDWIQINININADGLHIAW